MNLGDQVEDRHERCRERSVLDRHNDRRLAAQLELAPLQRCAVVADARYSHCLSDLLRYLPYRVARLQVKLMRHNEKLHKLLVSAWCAALLRGSIQFGLHLFFK